MSKTLTRDYGLPDDRIIIAAYLRLGKSRDMIMRDWELHFAFRDMVGLGPNIDPEPLMHKLERIGKTGRLPRM